MSVPMIIGEIRRYLRDGGAIRVSRSLKDIAYRALRCREEAMGEQSLSETAALLGVSENLLAHALDAVSEPFSLYEHISDGDGEGLMLCERISDPSDTEEARIEQLALHAALEELPPREAAVIFRRYFCGRTQIQVAGEVGISQAQVSRIEKAAISRMRRQMSVY